MDNEKKDPAASQLLTRVRYSCVGNYLLGAAAGLLVVIPIHPIAAIFGCVLAGGAAAWLAWWLASSVRTALEERDRQVHAGWTRITEVMLQPIDKHMN